MRVAATTLLASLGNVSPSWARAAQYSAADVGLDGLDVLLERYVRRAGDGINRVDYAGWAGSPADRGALDDLVRALQKVDPSALNRSVQVAYWCNLYNAETLRVVLKAYPVGSILAIRPSLLAIGPWKAKTLKVAGAELSLDDIENTILRRSFREPLVHYALNCASKGCPSLPPRTWRSATLNADLQAAARAYVNHPRGVRVTPRGLVLSSIYKWYRADFGSDDAAVLAHLARYAAPRLREDIEARPRILGYDYDWRLNDVTR